MPASAQRSISIEIHAPLRREDLPGLLRRTCLLLAGDDGEVLRCEVAGVEPDAVALDALARLALVARRSGRTVRLGGASLRLCELIAFAGLDDVLHA